MDTFWILQWTAGLIHSNTVRFSCELWANRMCTYTLFDVSNSVDHCSHNTVGTDKMLFHSFIFHFKYYGVNRSSLTKCPNLFLDRCAQKRAAQLFSLAFMSVMQTPLMLTGGVGLRQIRPFRALVGQIKRLGRPRLARGPWVWHVD